IAWDALEGRALHAEDDHLRLRLEGVEASGEGDGLENRRAALEIVATGLVHLTDHRDPEAADLAHDDRHLRRGDVLDQPPGQVILRLLRREPCGLAVVELRQRDLAVGPGWYRPAESRVVPDSDVRHVGAADHV